MAHIRSDQAESRFRFFSIGRFIPVEVIIKTTNIVNTTHSDSIMFIELLDIKFDISLIIVLGILSWTRTTSQQLCFKGFKHLLSAIQAPEQSILLQQLPISVFDQNCFNENEISRKFDLNGYFWGFRQRISVEKPQVSLNKSRILFQKRPS